MVAGARFAQAQRLQRGTFAGKGAEEVLHGAWGVEVSLAAVAEGGRVVPEFARLTVYGDGFYGLHFGSRCSLVKLREKMPESWVRIVLVMEFAQVIVDETQGFKHFGTSSFIHFGINVVHFDILLDPFVRYYAALLKVVEVQVQQFLRIRKQD